MQTDPQLPGAPPGSAPPGGYDACPECEEHLGNPTSYACEKCDEEVMICECCNMILKPCSCGHCPVGEHFVEAS